MNAFKLYCFISAACLALGETWFVVMTDKYPPLWLDDYLAAAAMLVSASLWQRSYGPALTFACWAFVFGNLYAMLFTRLEPINPPDRPWALLAILTLWAAISTGLALVHVIKRSKLEN
jgi:hypothetical protein